MSAPPNPSIASAPAVKGEPAGIRLPSWDAAPVPLPRQYIGPKRYGYPRIRRDPLVELEAEIAELKRRLDRLEGPPALDGWR